MAKLSVGHLVRPERRETLTRDRTDNDDDTVDHAIQIHTMPQLRAWMLTDPAAVLKALNDYRDAETEAVREFNLQIDHMDEYKAVYVTLDEINMEAEAKVVDLEAQLGEKAAVVKHQREQLKEAVLAAAEREREGTPTTVGSHSGKSTKIPDAPLQRSSPDPLPHELPTSSRTALRSARSRGRTAPLYPGKRILFSRRPHRPPKPANHH